MPGNKFPDLTGDGKVTKADILKGRGVKMMRGGKVPGMMRGGKLKCKAVEWRMLYRVWQWSKMSRSK